MQRIVRRSLELLGISAVATLAITALIALWHMINTPQSFESALPGEARIYRWRLGHIFYKVLGPQDAPPLVLLHGPGIGGSAYEMRKIIGPLAQQYRVYAPDLLGFGLSDHSHIDYSAETYTDLCHDFLSKVAAKPALLIASGLSCNYAVAAAARAPELCKGLVLISPTELFGGASPEGISSLVQGVAGVVQTPFVASLLYPLLTTRPVLRYGLERRLPNYSTPELDYLYASTHQLGAEHAPMALIAGKLTQDVSQQFEALQQPVLVIWGARALSNARSLASRYHAPARAQVILVQDSGLSVHEERPEAVVTNVREWSRDEGGKVAHATAATSMPTAERVEATVATVAVPKRGGKVTSSMPTTETVEAAIAGTPPPSINPGATGEKTHPATEQVEPALMNATNAPEIEAYCMKCKKKVVMQGAHAVTMKNGRPGIKGTCPLCGTGLYRIGRLE